MSASTIVRQNLDLLQQGIELLESLSDDAYRSSDDSGPITLAVGPHLRHSIEVYQCLLAGLPEGVVDYDARERQTEIERDRRAALQTLQTICDGLLALTAKDHQRPIDVLDGCAATDGTIQTCRSTVGRELQFVLSHTVHHYALIALVLRLKGHPVPDEFGVSAATIAHRKGEPSCAQ